ncbi:hypothetical protein S7711_09489 [Stachybotrys chartarum IBT 7711]|uniref:SMP-30/Gluconolactonase/LRE-like region domain-containing protein n=1 Tax=Stachybotrys chartarum (strain CBS 109288 / IBT 7711) TaxID=1280523 RepID=A0A084AFL5_STACB|nr:hypothetical protein S7711_09489 [Stachybotrys chartarum IBT 7711]KFA45744.1 hypothetical protein S40293_09459 [Stachybotrys chartarum IBT 40293]
MIARLKTLIKVIATFQPNTFLENVAARSDGSLLVTSVNPAALYYVPNPGPASRMVVPQTLATFNQSAMGIVETSPDIFYIATTDQMQGGGNLLWKLDMSSFGRLAHPREVDLTQVATFPVRSRVINGSARLSTNLILCADSWAGLIWKVEIPQDGGEPSMSVWKESAMFLPSSDPARADVPGVNGLKYNEKTHMLYFTTTSQLIFGRIPVDPDTLNPAGEPEMVTDRWMQADDFILDVEANAAYISTHRQNSIVKVDLTTGINNTIAGDPLDMDLIGPTSGAWKKGCKRGGRVAYFVTDGGIMNPVDGVVREAKVLMLDL